MVRKWNAVVLAVAMMVSLGHPALACRFSGTSHIALNGFMARGYGQVPLVLALGTLYLQFRRVGFTRSSFLWTASFIPIYFLNTGWHYRGIGGDCGYGEHAAAQQMVLYIGLMLLWQIAAALWLLRRRTKIHSAPAQRDRPA